MARILKIKVRQSPKNKQFYTSILAANGEPIFDGCEGHPRKKSADDMIAKLVAAIKSDNFKVVEELLEEPTPKMAGGKKPAPKEQKRKPGRKKKAVPPKEQMDLSLSTTTVN